MQSTTTSTFGTSSRVNHDASKFYNSRLYSNLKPANETPSIDNPFPPDLLNTVINHSCEKMSELPSNCVHCMVTSPPYNVSKEYDSDLSLNEYLTLLENVFTETYRVLVNGGRACVNVANLGRKPYIPLSTYVINIMQRIGFNMRGEVIWNKGATASSSCAWGSWQSASNPTLRDVHEYILIFSKGDYKRQLTASEKETKKNTITRDDFIEWTRSIWNMSAESARRIGHPAPYPVELPRRIIELYTYTGDIVLDPFMGSGTTAVAALKTARYYFGYELSSDYIKLIDKRVSEVKEEIEHSLFKSAI